MCDAQSIGDEHTCCAYYCLLGNITDKITLRLPSSFFSRGNAVARSRILHSSFFLRPFKVNIILRAQKVKIDWGMRSYERSGAGVTVTPILLLALLTIFCHSCLGSIRDEDGTSPRILTVLTTYHERTPFVKAYREAAADREDGLEPLVSGGWIRTSFIRCASPFFRRVVPIFTPHAFVLDEWTDICHEWRGWYGSGGRYRLQVRRTYPSSTVGSNKWGESSS